VGHVEVTVGSPGEAVEEFVTIFEAEAGEEDFGFVGAVIAVGILEEEEVRGLADVGSAVPEEDAGGEVESIGPDVDFIGLAIVVGIFEDFDAVARLLAVGCAHGVFVEFDDPESAAFVPGHGDGVGDHGFGGEEADFEARGCGEFGLGFGGGECGGGSWGVLAAHLFAGGLVGIDGEIEAGSGGHVIGCGCWAMAQQGEGEAELEAWDHRGGEFMADARGSDKVGTIRMGDGIWEMGYRIWEMGDGAVCLGAWEC
jgi:hypothetical protein